LKCAKKKCVSTYVGETSTPLITRIKEHLGKIHDEADLKKKENNASMFQIHSFKEHKILQQEDIKVEVLKVEINSQARKIIEAMQIKLHNPTLNQKNGFALIV
jgi:hypothetical protein